MSAIIFDLDQAFVDTSMLSELRHRRKWGQVYKKIECVKPYSGMAALIRDIRKRGAHVGFVTSSPGQYCRQILFNLNCEVDAVVAYHDTSKHKPHPEPIVYMLNKLAVSADKAMYVGDTVNDMEAARGAHVTPVAALWGSQEYDTLAQLSYPIHCRSVAELRRFITTQL